MRLVSDVNGAPVQVPITDLVNAQTVTFTTTTQSTAITTTDMVRLCSTANCWYSIGANPTAVVGGANSVYLPAGVIIYELVNSGKSSGWANKVAVIQDTTGGKLSILPCSSS